MGKRRLHKRFIEESEALNRYLKTSDPDPKEIRRDENRLKDLAMQILLGEE